MLEGYHYQNAYVTRDVDRWVETFSQRAKVDRVLRYEGSTPVKVPEGAGTQTNKLAFVWVGDLQYELIQPISGSVRIYSEALPPDDSLKFHHTCMRVPEWKEFRARVDDQPYPVVLEGGNEMLRFLYLDARPFLGHYVEYTWMTEERWTQMGGKTVPTDAGRS
jgi:Glyoxalase/Bleomycin resistance protein/Dioxygenase superfamily